MKYAIVSNPRDRISAGLASASSVAIVSLNLARRLAGPFEVLVVATRGPGEAARERIAPRLEVLRTRRRSTRLQKYRELAASAFESVPPYFLSDRYHHAYYEEAARTLAPERPDVIHIQNYGQAARVFRKHCPGASIVIQLHDTCTAQVDASVAKRILGDADLIVTCSPHVARTVSAAHPWIRVPVVPINNGVDLDDFEPRESARSHDAAEVRITYIGRLSPEKGVHVLIEAFNTVIERAPHARLELLGGASMFSYAVVKLFRRDPHWAGIFRFYGRNPMQRVFRHMHRSGHRYLESLKSMQSAQAAAATRWLGEQPHGRVADTIGAADIVAVPSVCDEPFGIPAVEAMAAGIAVVASAAGGLCDIVEPELTGFLTPRSDAGALAAALLRLIDDPQRRAAMGQAGRIGAERFTWERASQNLLGALERGGIAKAHAPGLAEAVHP